jgi:hypothetical protein
LNNGAVSQKRLRANSLKTPERNCAEAQIVPPGVNARMSRLSVECDSGHNGNVIFIDFLP